MAVKVKIGDILSLPERGDAHVVAIVANRYGQPYCTWATGNQPTIIVDFTNIPDATLGYEFRHASLAEVVAWRLSGVVSASAYEAYLRTHDVG